MSLVVFMLKEITKKRNNGDGIHWPDLDEDISLENILIGKPSLESSRSLQLWLKRRGKPNELKQ